MHCRDRWLAYAAFQFTLGGNILIHGVGRLSDLELENLLQRHLREFVVTALPYRSVYDFLVDMAFAEAF